jgi:predicted component of type VI protein secretion system
MAILDYEIGGNEVKIEGGEGIADIPQNRTLLVEKLTSDDPVNPEKAEGLTSVEDVFDHFKPNVDVEFQDESGQPVKENFKFSNVGDFNLKNLTVQSKFLNDLNEKKNFYASFMKQLRTNKVLQRALQNEESRQALIAALEELKKELDAEK